MSLERSDSGDDPTDELELTDEQRAALELDRNIAITAGAGTGKTTTLEERYRHILEEEPTLDPTNVVTITFTRDATAELRDGIREVVDQQLAGADTDEYERWRRAKDALEDAYVHTIHGFCSRLLREYAVEADVHPDIETLDETDSDVLISTVVWDIIATALDEGGDETTLQLPERRVDAISDDVRQLAQLYDRDELQNLLQGLVSERPESDTWADTVLGKTETEYVEDVVARACPVDPDEADTLATRDDVLDALETIQGLAGQEFGFTAEEDDGLATLRRLESVFPADGINEASTLDYQRLFLEVCDAATSNSGNVYSQSHYYAGSATRWGSHGREAENESLQEAFQTLIHALEPESRDLVDLDAAITSAPYVFALARVYQVVRDEYEARKADRNALDYSDLLERTVEFLETHDRARRELREQFEYIMVDEVQDTDPRQWDLIRLLTGTNAPEFDGQNVFLVGDEKQSIYRFRQADVTMVRRTRDQLAAANPEGVTPDAELTGNFRSLPETLEFVNDLFDRIFQPAADEYEPYEAEPQRLTAERDKGTDIEVSVEYLLTPERDEDVAAIGMEGSWLAERTVDSSAEREALAVAARLTRLFENPPTIYDREDDEYRPAKPDDVALLFRTTTRLRSFERALEEFDIPYSSVGGQSLYDTPEIEPLVNLLQVLQNPERDVPLYGVLRSPLFGFTDDELAELYHPEAGLWDRLQEAGGPLEAAAQRIQRWRNACGIDRRERSTKWGAFISQIVDETGYLVAVGADERTSQAVVNVNQFRETLRGWEEGAALPIADVLKRIERERSLNDDVGEAEIPSDVEGVQLRTVHSAKGLEFPIVLVPEFGRGAGGHATISDDSGRFPKDLAYLEEVDGDPVLGIKGPDPEDPLGTTATPDWTLAEAVQTREERAEAKRVLYVATTRARDHLILSSTHRFEENDAGELGLAEPEDPPSCWRDLAQPVLLEDRGVLQEIRTDGVAHCEVSNSNYEVRRPPAPTDGPGIEPEGELAHSVEIASPELRPTKTEMSATEFRDLIADRSDGQTTDSESASERAASDPFVRVDGREGLASTEFGTLVHRLCELALSGVDIDWEVHPYRVVEQPERLTPDDVDRAREHVRSGVSHVRDFETEPDVTGSYDEFQVTLDLDGGRIVGDIDHLTVTEDRYYVTDYKTDSLGQRTVDELAEHYWPQLRLYACALQQAAPKDEVVLQLVFTEGDERRTERVQASDANRYQTQFEKILSDSPLK